MISFHGAAAATWRRPLSLVCLVFTVGCAADENSGTRDWAGTRDTVAGVEIVRNAGPATLDSGSIIATEIWRTSGAGSEHLWENPSHLALGQGIVVMLDAQGHRVHVLDATNGAEVATFGREGDGPGEFRRPFGLAVDDSSIVVGNSTGPVLEFFAVDGAYRHRVRVGALSFLLEGLPDGRFWIVALDNGTGVTLFIDSGGDVTRVVVPDTAVADPAFVIGDCPRWSAWSGGLLRLHCRRLAYQRLDDEGRVSQEVYVDEPLVLATEEELKELEDRLGRMVNEAGLPPADAREFVEERLEIARVKPVFARIRADSASGHTFVQRQVPDGESSGPAALLVLNADGRLLGRIHFARPWRDFRILGDRLYAIEEDPATGLAEVVAHDLLIPEGG